jgi:hypothetical protein
MNTPELNVTLTEGMSIQDKINLVKKTFDALTGESYFGINMRLVMIEKFSPEFLNQMLQFAETCKAVRLEHSQKKDDSYA